MTAPSGRSLAHWLFAAVLALCLGHAGLAFAKNTGVDDDTALETGPCYQALVDRNVAQPTTAPKRELGAACAQEHDDVERAWARVVRLWGSDSADLPDYDSYVPSTAGEPPGLLSITGAMAAMVLVLALCGTPLRSAAFLLSGSGRPIAQAGQAIGSLVLRGLLGLLLLWILSSLIATVIGSLLFIAVMARGLAAPPRPGGAFAAAESGAAAFAAEALNDLGGAAPGLLGLALLARHDARFIAAALVLAVVVSVPAVIVARRALRTRPVARIVLGALLAAAITLVACLDPAMPGFAGSSLFQLIAALALASAVAAWGWRSMRFAPAPGAAALDDTAAGDALGDATVGSPHQAG